MMDTLEYDGITIHFEDCIEGMRNIKPYSVQSIITDPPFGIGFNGKCRNYSRTDSKVVDGYVEVPFEEYFDFSYKWLTQARRILKEDGTCYVFCPHQHVHSVIEAGLKSRLKYSHQLIYVRSFPLYKTKSWVTAHYNIILFTKTEDYLYNMIEEYQKNVLFEERNFQTGDTLAPTALCRKSVTRLILASTNVGDLIVEPFVGSGTVPYLSWNLRRKCIGFELNPNMREIIDSYFGHSITDMKVSDDTCPICGSSLETVGFTYDELKLKCSACKWREL